MNSPSRRNYGTCVLSRRRMADAHFAWAAVESPARLATFLALLPWRRMATRARPKEKRPLAA